MWFRTCLFYTEGIGEGDVRSAEGVPGQVRVRELGGRDGWEALLRDGGFE